MFWPDVACYSGVWCHPRTASFFSSSYQLVAVSGLSTVDISYKAKILINFHEMAPPWTRRWPAFGWHCCRTPVFFAHLFQIIPDILTGNFYPGTWESKYRWKSHCIKWTRWCMQKCAPEAIQEVIEITGILCFLFCFGYEINIFIPKFGQNSNYYS